MTKRRVVVTGVGVVSGLGAGQGAYWAGLRAGRSGVRRITSFDPGGFPSQAGGEVPDLAVNQWVPKAYRKAAKLMSRDIALAVAAADTAIRDAGIKTKGTAPDETPDLDPMRSGVNIGAGLICCDLVELGAAVEHAVEDGRFSFAKWGREGMEAMTPLWLLKYLPNMLGCHVSIIHDLQGPNNSITCAEASGLLAVGEAFRTIQRGGAEVMVAGGAECRVTPLGLIRQWLLKRLSTRHNDRPAEACRPFDAAADGGVVGEGAGIVVLEELEHAQRRGARIYGEVKGFGASNNFVEGLVAPEPESRGTTIALQKALAEARVEAGALGLVVAHGSAVPAEDRAEARGIASALGRHAAQTPLTATKGYVGNCGAGAAAVDLATAVLVLEAEWLPPVRNCTSPTANCGLQVVHGPGRAAALGHVVSCCHTYGGQTAAMVVSRWTQ